MLGAGFLGPLFSVWLAWTWSSNWDGRNLQFFFYLGIFHEHSQITGQKGKGEAISLTSLYHFHPFHKDSDISLAITAESSPLHIASQPDSKQKPLVSEHKSLTNKLRTLMSALLLYSKQFQSFRTLTSSGSKWDWRDLRTGKFRWARWRQQSEAVCLVWLISQAFSGIVILDLSPIICIDLVRTFLSFVHVISDNNRRWVY